MYYNNSGRHVRVRDGRLSAEKPRTLLQNACFGGPVLTGRAYDVTADGERFLMIKDIAPGTARIAVVQNWSAELRRLAPE